MFGSRNKVNGQVIIPCLYFEKPGPQNTKKTLEAAACRAEELGLNDIVVASNTGETGFLAAEIFKGKNLVVVTHSTGFTGPDIQEFPLENRKKLKEAGVKVLTCQHAMGGVGRAVRKKFGTYQLEEIIAFTLRIFGQGVKVAVEIALMAADAGLISTKKYAVSIGGTSRGADTALIIQPAHAQNFFDLRIHEILAKPRLY